jgi:hypothetical protein
MSATLQITGVAAYLLATSDLPHAKKTKAILNPAWGKARRTHDWRNHVPDEVKAAWPLLTPDARVVAYVISCKLADREIWD